MNNLKLMEGLSSKEAQKLLQKYGENTIRETGKIPLWKKFLEQFTDFMVLTLMGAAIIAFLVAVIQKDYSEMIDVYMILGIVILNAIIGFIQEYKSEKAIEALKKMLSPHGKVYRDGELKNMETRYVVPGDIFMAEAGDKIPADAILLESSELKIDESMLTGESTTVHKDAESKIQEKKILFMGTNVVSGTAKALVQKTGMQTKFGKIAHLTVSTKKDRTPLQKELKRVGIFIGKVAIVISVILFIVGLALQKQTLIHSLLFSVAVAVAAVPEGLPAIVTITLALGVQKLAKKRAIVKQLSSVETLGSTTVICSDKTGTLTRNEMTVQEISLGENQSIQIDGVGYDPENGTIHFPKNYERKAAKLLFQISALCNNAKLQEEKNKWKIIGDPTEGALQTLATKGEKYESLELEKFTRIKEHPFDSVRKRMSVHVEQDGKKYIFAKGAPDNLLKISSHILIDGEKIPLTGRHKKEIIKKSDLMAEKALRIIGFAYKEVTEKKMSEKEAEQNLIFVGLAGMIDPPRKEVPKAVELCRQAGIRIIMVTGDYGPTAMAIGKNIGMVNKNTRLITGDELEKMSETQLGNALGKKENIIFARIKPEHKLRIVENLKKHDEIVAVTGDGVNDAPALKRADIGVAMGITGTEVSKEASNMILTDDSFASIITAISQGRSIYENLKKFIWFIMSSNIGEVLTIFLAIILFLPSPFTAILILAVNIGTDVLPALALGMEKPEQFIMQAPPRNPKKRILNRKFVTRMFYVGFMVSLVTIGAYTWILVRNGWHWGEFPHMSSEVRMEAMTAAFATLVLTQLFNAINARSEKTSMLKLPQNYYLLGAIGISIAIVLAIVELPILQNLFRTTGLSIADWITITLASSSLLIVEEARKKLAPNLFS